MHFTRSQSALTLVSFLVATSLASQEALAHPQSTPGDVLIVSDPTTSALGWERGAIVPRTASGGSGRHGALVVRSGETLVLDTDRQRFPIPPQLQFSGQLDQVSTNLEAVTDFDPLDAQTWPSIIQTDGIFEFSSLTIEAGGTLSFVGTNPARIYVSGEARIEGILSASGASNLQHDSSSQYGQTGALGGPGGGRGGNGATRYDALPYVTEPSPNQFLDLVCKGALGHPDCTFCGANFCLISPFAQRPSDIDGQDGEAPGSVGAGNGGVHWPPQFPRLNLVTSPLFGDGAFNRLFEANGGGCHSLQVASGGSGGAFATPGTDAEVRTAVVVTEDIEIDTPDGPPMEVLLNQAGTMNRGPAASGAPAVPLTATDRSLDPLLGALRGGAGGGGGGAHLLGMSGLSTFSTCQLFSLDTWRDHSACGGGGGGGALQLTAGRSTILDGLISATGGDGGSSLPSMGIEFELPTLDQNQASPGGGGSGGAVLLRAPSVVLGTGLIDVSGGVGGLGVQGSVGGDGGIGLVRVEDRLGPNPLAIAPSVVPFDPGVPDSINILSVAQLQPGVQRPDSISTLTSPWVRPKGTFNLLVFEEDDPNASTVGWDLTLRVDAMPGAGEDLMEVPFRRPNTILPSTVEELFGNQLNNGLPSGTGSPLAVRFQGARSNGALDLEEDNFVPGSITPWVSHPSELNDFQPGVDVWRYRIVFDSDVSADALDFVRGVTDIRVAVTPQ